MIHREVQLDEFAPAFLFRRPLSNLHAQLGFLLSFKRAGFGSLEFLSAEKM